MYPRRRWSMVAFLALSACITPPSTQVQAESVTAEQRNHRVSVKVNPAVKMGPLPRVFRAGSYHWYLPDPPTEKAFDRFLAEQKVGTIGIMLDSVLEPSENLDDLAARLSAWDDVAKKVSARGGEVLIQIWGMPMWVSSNRSGRTDTGTLEVKSIGAKSAPRDYVLWSKVVYAIVDHFNNRLKLDCRYQVWAEPDLHWLGTEEEYLNLYKYSVLGARKADPKAKIGGPGLAGWNARFERVKGPLSRNHALLNFIQYCSKTDLPELGLKRLPIDFIIWHVYNADPFNPFAVAEPARIIRRWLGESGFSKATPLVIGEWNIWQGKGKNHAYFSPEHDTEIAASYIVAMLEGMHRAGIESHMFTTLFETKLTPREEEFTGNFALFTKNKIVKPSYNAFRAVSMLGKTMIETTTDDDFLVAIGTTEDDRIALLLSNFIPYGTMTDQILLMPRKAPLPPEVKYGLLEIVNAAGMTREDLEKARRGDIAIDKVNVSPEMRKDLDQYLRHINRHAKELKTEEWRRGSTVTVALDILNLPFKNSFRYQRFTIDSAHGNSFAIRHRIMESARKGSSDFNDWPEVKLSPVEDRRIDPNDSKAISFPMKPYSVDLVIFSR